MYLSQEIPTGKNVPEDIYVIIEISANSNPIKYEIEKNSGALFVDRFIPSTMFYPCNYGYVNNTLSLDGDPIDVLVPSPYPLNLTSIILCRPIGILRMIDESGIDTKIIAVPHTTVSKQYDDIKDITDLSKLLRSQITYFFEHYKDLEKDKWIKIEGWDDVKAAKEEIISSIKRAQRIN
ncbi:inorganic diphosphatase [Pantoea sp. Aalb]|uniref:inorganic diphosphatase n=1 Tax=Pantoea sp. Aalb TaxID=2576762 RepID=UPI00132BEF39|nr:inorganic diphosphatase [Pantoea sp. Aalb]MXP67690.1 inorganic diphosphatase [Pantoea sp. Aalb]